MAAPRVPSVTVAQHEALLRMTVAVPAILKLIMSVTPEMAMVRRRKVLLEMTMARSVVLPALRRSIPLLNMISVVIVEKNRRDCAADGNAVV